MAWIYLELSFVELDSEEFTDVLDGFLKKCIGGMRANEILACRGEFLREEIRLISREDLIKSDLFEFFFQENHASLGFGERWIDRIRFVLRRF